MQGVKRVAPPSPPGKSNYVDLAVNDEIVDDFVEPSDPHDAQDHEEQELKEEKEVMEELAKLGDAAVIKKLDVILDRKFNGIYGRLVALEKRQASIFDLIQRGVDSNDAFWNFENPRYLKPLNRYYGMVDMMYSMMMEAIDFNKGVLRKKPKRE